MLIFASEKHQLHHFIVDGANAAVVEWGRQAISMGYAMLICLPWLMICVTRAQPTVGHRKTETTKLPIPFVG